LEPGRVAEVGMGAIAGEHAGLGGGQRQAEHHRVQVGRVVAADALRFEQVAQAELEAGHARVRGGDLGGVAQPARGFDVDQQARHGGAGCACDRAFDVRDHLAHLRGRFELGHVEQAGAGGHDRSQVGGEVRAAGGVDAHDRQRAGVRARSEERGHVGAGARLALLGHRILQVEGHRVGAAGPGLGEQVRTGAGYEQLAAHHASRNRASVRDPPRDQRRRGDVQKIILLVFALARPRRAGASWRRFDPALRPGVDLHERAFPARRAPPRPEVGGMALSRLLPPSLQEWLGGITVLLQVVVVALGALLLRWLLLHLVRRLAGRYDLPAQIVIVARRTLSFVVSFAALLLVLRALGVSGGVLWGAFTGFATVAAVAFFALWSVLTNVFCALLILVTRPFRLLDHIELVDSGDKPGLRGRVVDMNLVYVTLAETHAGGGESLL